MPKKKLKDLPKAYGAAAIYPYSDALYELGVRTDRFGEEYQLFRIVGSGDKRRIWVPRKMAHQHGENLIRTGLPTKYISKFKPRNAEQERVIAESVMHLKNGENFLVECPTGFGKTACGMDIISKVGKKTLVVVTKEDLRDQWIEAASKFLGLSMKDIGLIQGDTFQVTGKKLVIAMIQSLAKEDRYPVAPFNEFGLAIWDECHRVAADYFSQSCFRVPAALRLGLSATPDRKDGKEEVLFSHIGRVLVKSEAAPMTPRVIVRRSPWKVPLVRTKKKDGTVKLEPMPHSPGKCGHIINMLCNYHPRNEMLANFTAAAYKKGRTILVQSDRKEHLETLAMMFQKLGIPPAHMGYYVGGMKAVDLDNTKAKRIILATYQMTAEGTDIPWLDTLVMATPKSDVRQIVGRIIRQYEGKQEPVVFDLVDASSNVFSGYWNSRRTWYGSIDAPLDLGKPAN